MEKSAEIAEKIDRITRMLGTEGLGGVLLGSQPNFAWLTAGGTNGIDRSREPGAGALLVRADGKVFVLANRIEMPRLLDEEVAGTQFEPVEFGWEDEKIDSNFLADHARSLLGANALLGSDLPLGQTVRTVEADIAQCRYQLTTAEVRRLRQLGQDAGKAMGELVRVLEPGESERQVARRATDALAAYDIHPVVVLVAADERLQRYRHPVPTDRRWEKVLMVVACARRGGLVSSLTRIVCIGPADDELRKRTVATARVNARLCSHTRQGVSGAELYRVASDAYASEGFAGEERLHHQGGACGYRTRDWVAHPASQERVQADQAFAWNPSITGTKVEETIITNADGVETTTSSPGWPQITTQIDGREYFSPDVLSL